MTKHFEKHLIFSAVNCFFENKRHKIRLECIDVCSMIHHVSPELRVPVKGVGVRPSTTGHRLCPRRALPGVRLTHADRPNQAGALSCSCCSQPDLQLGLRLQNRHLVRVRPPNLKCTELTPQRMAEIWFQVNWLTFPLRTVSGSHLLQGSHTLHFPKSAWSRETQPACDFNFKLIPKARGDL